VDGPYLRGSRQQGLLDQIWRPLGGTRRGIRLGLLLQHLLLYV
jgi:hypothetical protein